MPSAHQSPDRPVETFERLVVAHGGAIRTGADVAEIIVGQARATGVRLSDGEMIAARRAVVASVTPTQLYGRLLRDTTTPAAVWQEAATFRHSRGEMQIHLALSASLCWPDPALDEVAMTSRPRLCLHSS